MTATEDHYHHFRRLTARDRQWMARIMTAALSSSVPLIPAVAEHITEARGKGLRPMLLLGAARHGGYEGHHHRFLAAAVEIIHTATLLHDDVIDESARRRGRVTAHKRWSNKASILVGDFFLAKAFDVVVRYGDDTILRVLSSAAADIAEGEALQLVTMNQLEVEEAVYCHIISCKTARLFAASLEMGARLAAASDAVCRAWHSYGMALGVFYQQLDDIMDYCGHDGGTKAMGEDFRQGRVTLPVIHAYRHGTQRERALIEKAFARKDEAHWRELRQLLHECGSLQHVFGAAHENYEKARAISMRALDNNEWLLAIGGVGEFCYLRGEKSLRASFGALLAA